jgi:hypothetical protein
MIRHTILFKAKPSISEQVITSAIANFLTLKDKLPGVATIIGGKCSFHEAKVAERANHFFTHAFSIDFKDEDALNTFFSDPVTHSAKDDILNIAVGGYEGIIGFELKFD